MENVTFTHTQCKVGTNKNRQNGLTTFGSKMAISTPVQHESMLFITGLRVIYYYREAVGKGSGFGKNQSNGCKCLPD